MVCLLYTSKVRITGGEFEGQEGVFLKVKGARDRRVVIEIQGCLLYTSGTYILFQETYSKEHYEALHPTGPKSHYAYHTDAMDRAMEGGIDDVGIGVLLDVYKRQVLYSLKRNL